jgi:hypothetical protein
VDPNNLEVRPRNGLRRIAWLVLLFVGGLAFFWLVVLRIVAKLHGGEPCPFALAWIVDNPSAAGTWPRYWIASASSPASKCWS